MRFSQRIGKSPVRVDIQLEDMDWALRVKLWNCLHLNVFDRTPPYTSNEGSEYFAAIWHDFFERPIDTIPDKSSDAIEQIRDQFFEKLPWYRIYDLLELLVSINQRTFSTQDFINSCNLVLKGENSGYRFVEKIITPITSSQEIEAIEEAIRSAEKANLAGTNIHLRDALSKLSDRKNPDYRNSIKESISAVESVSKKITNSNSSGLEDALKILEQKVDLNRALRDGFVKLYGWTSSSDGIRHALMEEPDLGFDEAKYMLVSCSAFVTYLISLASKANLEF